MSFDNVENELGAIVNFAQNCDENGYSLVSVQPWYPDAVIFSERHGRELFAEFEYTSSSFLQHRHDIRKCDVLICWIQDEQVGIPTIVLSEGVWNKGTRLMKSWRICTQKPLTSPRLTRPKLNPASPTR